MKRFHFLTAVLAGTCMYVLISLIGGQDGLLAAHQMIEQKRLLSTHTAEIQRIHDQLDLEYKALEKDPDVISAYARKLGYVSDGEKLVKINGLASSVNEIYDTGTIQKPVKPYFIPEWFCKMSALFFGIIVFIMLTLKDYHRSSAGKKQPVLKGIPIYDLPQV